MSLQPSRLGLQILLFFAIAVTVAVAVYFLTEHYSGEYISSHFDNSKAIQNQTKQELDNFQYFVTTNGISTDNNVAIKNWVKGEKYLLINIYKDEYLVYSSNYPDYSVSTNKFKIDEVTPTYRRLYNVNFSDGKAQVGIYYFAALKYYDIAEAVELVLAFVCFVVIFLVLISSKFKYISKLQGELKVIESGDLDIPVTIKGNDEISLLARGIDEMRVSFAERIKSEKEARRANSELITSISHDLRTPLTILIGDLDVISGKKYKTDEQFARYIENSRKKAYQLKELSDKLFEYFLVFGSEYQEPVMESVNCGTLMTQLIGEYSLSLEDRGFQVEISGTSEDCLMEANVIAVRRVFDNLFNNILKYAETGSKVSIAHERSGDILSVRIRNRIGKVPEKVESTNIGLATCEKIMVQHGGIFSVSKTDAEFIVTLGFRVNDP